MNRVKLIQAFILKAYFALFVKFEMARLVLTVCHIVFIRKKRARW